MRVSVQAGVSTPELAAFVMTKSKMSLFAAGLDVANGNLILRLDEGTVLPYSDLIPPVTTETLGAHASQVEAHTESSQRAAAALPGNGGSIEFANGISAVDNAIRVKIADAIHYTKRTFLLGQKRIPLEITGYRNTSEGANVSLARADAVAAEIRTLGQFGITWCRLLTAGQSFGGTVMSRSAPLACRGSWQKCSILLLHMSSAIALACQTNTACIQA
jgi:hypothetical protein